MQKAAPHIIDMMGPYISQTMLLATGEEFIVQSTGGQRSKWSISEVFLHILVRDP